MVETVCRVYDSRSRAEAAVAALKEAGFTDAEIFGATVTDEPSREAYVAALRRADIPAEAAGVYADRLVQGASLVVVQPSFGMAGRAIAIVQQHQPITLEVPQPAAPAGTRADPTPFSTWMHWRTLSSTPLPFEKFFGWRSLIPGRKYYAERWWGGGLLSQDPTPMSSRFGWAVLSSNRTPLSSKMNWPLLRDEPRLFSDRLGWRTLSANRTPFSAMFGWALLSGNPTPFSSRFGWSLLSNEPAPFSAWMGWKLPPDR
jgi:hypothetical protein